MSEQLPIACSLSDAELRSREASLLAQFRAEATISEELDLTFTENWMIAEGDKVAVCSTAKGTHDGAFRGVRATGKRYELASMTVWRFVDGKVAEEWVFFNELDLYRQLGLFKEPRSTDR